MTTANWIPKAQLTHAAYMIAVEAHKGQLRRGGEPYCTHLTAVEDHLVRRGLEDPLVRATALLHDVIEDTKTTEQDLLNAGIHPIVVEAVVAMTKRKGEPYADYLQRVADNPLALQVKISDMACNLADAPTPEQIMKYAEGLNFLVNQ